MDVIIHATHAQITINLYLVKETPETNAVNWNFGRSNLS